MEEGLGLVEGLRFWIISGDVYKMVWMGRLDITFIKERRVYDGLDGTAGHHC